VIGPDAPVCIVVPCYNEAARLDVDAFAAHALANDWLQFWFVDDGSSDGTSERLTALAARCPLRIRWFSLPKNQGKAEAVRQGTLRAFADEPRAHSVGFWDADLATPLADIRVFADILDREPRLLSVLGSRVNLLGRDVKRNLVRHWVGRVFATMAATVLRLSVYDTQCGAKLFRATPLVRGLFAERFVSRWIFDVEVLARLRDALAASGGPPCHDVVYEHPLMVWRDVKGSKLRPRHFVTVGIDLLRIARRHRRRPVR